MKLSRDTTIRIVILLLLNSVVPLVWFVAGLGDHGQSAEVVYGSLLVTAVCFIGAVVALLNNKKTLSLLLGLAVPVGLFVYVAFFSLVGVPKSEATDAEAYRAVATKPFDLRTFETVDALASELRARLPVQTSRQSVDALLVEAGGATVEQNPDEANVYHYRHEFFAPAIRQDWRWNIAVRYDEGESVDQIWVNGSAVHRDKPFSDGKLE